jgi:sulfur-oxidizing protein SoxX
VNGHIRSAAAWLLLPAVLTSCAASAAEPVLTPIWNGDAIELPLFSEPGDAARGRSIVQSRQTGLCLLCHSLDASGSPNQGTLAPPLAGAGTRWSAAQLRARLVDSRRVSAQSLMPAYFVELPVDGVAAGVAASGKEPGPTLATGHIERRVAAAWQGRRLLDARQIEDVIAYLLTLREP